MPKTSTTARGLLTDSQRLDFLAKHGWVTFSRKEGGNAYLAVGEDHPIRLPVRELIDVAFTQDQKAKSDLAKAKAAAAKELAAKATKRRKKR